MGNEWKTREISIIDVLVDICLHWRSIIVVMLIGGVLFGSFSYIRSVKNIENQKQAESVLSMDAIQAMLTPEELENVKIAVANQRLYDEYMKYQESSVLMNIDATDVPTAEIIFGIESDAAEESMNIVDAYKSLILSTESYQFLAEKCGVSADLSELISIKSYADNSEVRDSLYITTIDNIFSVQIVYSDEENCVELAEAMTEFVLNKQTEFKALLGRHEVNVLNNSMGTLSRIDILEKQKACLDRLVALQSTCEKQQTEIEGNALLYFNNLMFPDTQENMSERTSEEVLAATPGISIKYVVLGMLLFALIEAFVLFVLYILNNKLKATDEIQNIYNIPQLGYVEYEKKRRFGGFIDALILKLQASDKRYFSQDKAISLATTAVKVAVKKADANMVCFVGCNLHDDSLEFCNCVKIALEQDGISVHILDNVLYDAESMETLADMSHVVLVETVGVTLYREIEQELELMARQNINVLGGIVVG